MKVWVVLVIILVVLLAALAALYFVGRKAQKKQEDCFRGSGRGRIKRTPKAEGFGGVFY